VAAVVAGGFSQSRYNSNVPGGISGQIDLRPEQCNKMYRIHKFWNAGTKKYQRDMYLLGDVTEKQASKAMNMPPACSLISLQQDSTHAQRARQLPTSKSPRLESLQPSNRACNDIVPEETRNDILMDCKMIVSICKQLQIRLFSVK
jgi:hypothetical protein